LKLPRLVPLFFPPLSVLFPALESVLENIEPDGSVSAACRGTALISVAELFSELVRQPQAAKAVIVAQDMLGCIEKSLEPQALRLYVVLGFEL
jgi:hypothetical protein